MVSGEWQKPHFVSPSQCRLTRLSLVKIIPFFQTLYRILICQISCEILIPLLIKAAYMDFNEKLPDEYNAQTKMSLSSCKFTSCREFTVLCQSLRFAPTKFRQKEIFGGDELSTYAIESYFLLTILNNAGNISFRGLFSNQVWDQNQVCVPSFTLKAANPMKVSVSCIECEL